MNGRAASAAAADVLQRRCVDGRWQSAPGFTQTPLGLAPCKRTDRANLVRSGAGKVRKLGFRLARCLSGVHPRKQSDSNWSDACEYAQRVIGERKHWKHFTRPTSTVATRVAENSPSEKRHIYDCAVHQWLPNGIQSQRKCRGTAGVNNCSGRKNFLSIKWPEIVSDCSLCPLITLRYLRKKKLVWLGHANGGLYFDQQASSAAGESNRRCLRVIGRLLRHCKIPNTVLVIFNVRKTSTMVSAAGWCGWTVGLEAWSTDDFR
jgi:hypothetical protein